MLRPLPTIVLALALFGCGDDPGPLFDQCQPGVAPDAACYAQKRAPSSANITLASQVALGYIARHPAAKLAWDWGEGVLMLSLVELHRVSGDSRLRDYFKAWLDAHITKGYDIKWSDSCPPALAALALAEGNGSAPYRKVVDDVVAYFRAAPRTDDGGISHMGHVLPLHKTLWVDSLFMVGMPMIRAGERQGDQALIDAVGGQFTVFARTLQKSGGLMTHASNWPGQKPDVFWGRGNAWVTAAGHEYLRAQRLRGRSDDAVEALIERQLKALLPLQDAKTGLWWTVLNQPGKTYLETSASALFAYGLARGYRYGARDAAALPVIAKAMAGVRSMIKTASDKTPMVTGTSGPTMPGSASFYGGIAKEDDLHFGVGAVILALIETSGLPL